MMTLWSRKKKERTLSRFPLAVLLAGTAMLAGCGDDDDDDGEDSDDESTAAVVIDVVDDETTESGEQGEISVRLATEPSSNVLIAVSSNDPTEGIVEQEQLTFTPDNWNSTQSVIVTGVDDEETDGNKEYSIDFSEAVSDDQAYDGLPSGSAVLTNVDDETPGVTVSEVDGDTSESGDQATFTVALTARPSRDVSFSVESTDPSEGVAGPVNLVFTPENWSAPQEVVVTGVDDAQLDGDVTYQVDLSESASEDESFDGLEGPAVDVVNLDDDTPGLQAFVVDGVSSELGEQALVEFTLQAEPSDSVTVTFSVSDDSEAELINDELFFTPENWAARHVVPIVGVNDDDLDGNQDYDLVVDAVVSDDETYDGLEPPPISLVNLDDDSAGILVTATDDTSSESGASAQVEVVLLAPPSDDVTVDVFSSQKDEGVPLTDQLVFTPDNWSAVQTVTVVGQDDDETDGNQTYALSFETASSGDDDYDGLVVPNAALVNVDDETAAILAEVTDARTNEAGNEATMEVWLGAQPTAEVTVPLSINDPTEATLVQQSLVFTPDNYDSRQVVRAVGVDDAIDDGNQPFSIEFGAAQSQDEQYDGLTRRQAEFVNDDTGETAAVVVRQSSVETVSEGDFIIVEVLLASQPTSEVTIPVESSKPSQALVSPNSLSFNMENWNAPRAVLVQGVDDDVEDGDQNFDVVFGPVQSVDTNYEGIAVPNRTLRVIDDDVARLVVEVVDDESSEAGKDAAYRVSLSTEPSDDVSIVMNSSDASEGMLSRSQLTFTPQNYASPQLVSAQGQDDELDDGNQSYQVLFEPASSSDADYDGMTLPPIELINRDDDTAGLVVRVQDASSGESNSDRAVVSVNLASKPTDDVTIGASSSDESEAVLQSAQLVFTPDNWNAPQDFILLGQDDALADGNQEYALVFGTAMSGDDDYAGLSAETVKLVNLDDDSAGFEAEVVEARSSESAGEAVVELRLLSQPTDDVVVEFASSDPTEALASPSQVTFDATNWSAPQAVSLQGQDDELADGNQAYQLLWSVTSQDEDYASLATPPVSLLNVDDDSAGVSVTVVDERAGEDGGEATVEVVLNSEPFADVDVSVQFSSNELMVEESTLTLGAADWDQPQEFVFAGQNDALADGDQVVEVEFAVSSSDATYDGFDLPSVELINTDNNTAAVVLEALGDDLETSEEGDQIALTLVLTAKPTASVTVSLESGDASEGTLSAGSVEFGTDDYNVPRSVTVTGVDDELEDGDQLYVVEVTGVTSSDEAYEQATQPSLQLRNLDDDQ